MLPSIMLSLTMHETVEILDKTVLRYGSTVIDLSQEQQVHIIRSLFIADVDGIYLYFLISKYIDGYIILLLNLGDTVYLDRECNAFVI